MAMMSGIVLDCGGEEARHRGVRDAPPQGRIGRTRPRNSLLMLSLSKHEDAPALARAHPSTGSG
jgi:hypothetical protein